MDLRISTAVLAIFLATSVHAAPKKKKKAEPEPVTPAEDLLAAPPAAAAVPDQKLDSDLLKQGVQAYEDLDYAKCVELLQKALNETLTRDEKIITYKTLAFCHVGLDKPDAAKFDFENLLHLDESFELDRRVSPRVRAPFEEAKAAIATGQSVEGDANELQFRAKTLSPLVQPQRPREGQPVSISASDPTGLAMTGELFFRTRGQPVFSKTTSQGERGQYSLTVPGLNVQPPGTEYYLQLLDEQNTTVARAGNQKLPLFVEVTARKRPVYTKGWFWGVLGGVVVVAAVAGGVAGGLAASNTISPSTPASVTIQPQ